MFGRKNKDEKAAEQNNGAQGKERAFVKKLNESKEFNPHTVTRSRSETDAQKPADKQPLIKSTSSDKGKFSPVKSRSADDVVNQTEMAFDPKSTAAKFYLDCFNHCIGELEHEIKRQIEIKQKPAAERTVKENQRLESNNEDNLLKEFKAKFLSPHQHHAELKKMEFKMIQEAKTIAEFKLALALTASDTFKMSDEDLISIYEREEFLELYLDHCKQIALKDLEESNNLKTTQNNFMRLLNQNISLKVFVDSTSNFANKTLNEIKETKEMSQLKVALQTLVAMPIAQYFQTCKAATLATDNIDTEQGLKSAKEKFREMMLAHFKGELYVDSNAFASTYQPITLAKNKAELATAMDKVMQSRAHSPTFTSPHTEKDDGSLSAFLARENPNSFKEKLPSPHLRTFPPATKVPTSSQTGRDPSPTGLSPTKSLTDF